MVAREELHELIEDLPENTLPAARSYLRYLAERGSDPVLQAFVEAPIDDEGETTAEREAMDEARQDLAAGRVVSHEEVRRKLLGP